MMRKSGKQAALLAALFLTAAFGTVSGVAAQEVNMTNCVLNSDQYNTWYLRNGADQSYEAVGTSNKNISVSFTSNRTASDQNGIVGTFWVKNGGKIIAGDSDTESVSVSATSLYRAGALFADTSGDIAITGNTVTLAATSTGSGLANTIATINSGTVEVTGTTSTTIKAESTSGKADAVISEKGGKVTLSGGSTEITASGSTESMGLYALTGGSISVDGKLTIDSTATTGDSYGIIAQGQNSTASGESIVTVSGDTTIKNAKIGIASYSGSTVTLSGGDLTIEDATDAINTRGSSSVSINQDSAGTVTLNGDVDFGGTSDSPNATVNLNLGEGGSWNGSSKVTTDESGTTTDATDETVFNLTMGSGSSWTSTADSFVTTLNATNATINGSGNFTVLGAVNLNDGSTLSVGGNMAANDNTVTLGDNSKVTVSGTTSNVTYAVNGVTWNETPVTVGTVGDNVTVDAANLSISGLTGVSGGDNVSMNILEQTSGSGTPTVTNGGPKNLTIGTTLQGTGTVTADGSNAVLTVDVSSEAQPQTHRAVMAQSAGLTTVFGGFDFLDRAVNAVEGENGVTAFASVGGGEHKYDTGSHIKTNAWHGLAGVGTKNGSLQYGVFYDYGDGHYRTYDSSGRGDGKAIYKGGGLFGKYTTASDLYVEGSFRAGRVKNTANGVFSDAAGNRYDLKTNSNYNAFHVGVGKVLSLDEGDSLDVYGKFFHTHVNGDSFNAGGHYDLDSVDSNILRVGTRWNLKRGAWNHYLGVAYEYEFDGEAKGTADGAHIESADIGGSSVRFEIGTSVETGKWVIGFNADAYAGQHKGFDGSITAGLRF